MAINLSDTTVLLIEDTAPLRQMLVSLLERLNVKCIHALDNAEDGYEALTTLKPDVVIADYNLPGMNGTEFTAKLRQDKNIQASESPVILMSGDTAPDIIANARDSGVTEFLVKPFSTNTIAKMISHVIHQPRKFITAATYKGPDRRRCKSADYHGPMRRSSDSVENCKTPTKKPEST